MMPGLKTEVRGSGWESGTKVELYVGAAEMLQVPPTPPPFFGALRSQWEALGFPKDYIKLGEATADAEGTFRFEMTVPDLPPNTSLDATKGYYLVYVSGSLVGSRGGRRIMDLLASPKMNLKTQDVEPGTPLETTSTGWLSPKTLKERSLHPSHNLWVFLDERPVSCQREAAENGELRYALDTTGLSPGVHVVRIRQYHNTRSGTDFRMQNPPMLEASASFRIVATEKIHQPVIFLPGVGGTQLKRENNELWPLFSVLTTDWRPRDQARLDLQMREDGNTAMYEGANVEVGDILQSGLADFYSGLMSFLEHRLELGKTLYAFPYDWRMDNRSHLDRLDALVNRARANSRSDRVYLVAHSMGGIVARAYVMSSPERAAKIEALITLGTPWWGSPKVYYGLTMGYTFDNHTVGQVVMKVLAQNMAAAYQLCPKRPFILDPAANRVLPLEESFAVRYKGFYDYEPRSLPFPRGPREPAEAPGDRERGIELTVVGGPVGPWFLCYPRNTALSTPDNIGQLNQPLLAKGRAFWEDCFGTPEAPKPVPGDTKLYVIIGYRCQTPSFFRIREPKPKESFLEFGTRRVVMEPMFADGDGTVPLWSSELRSATRAYYVPQSVAPLPQSATHSKLPANTTVQQLVWALVNGKEPSDSDSSVTLFSTRDGQVPVRLTPPPNPVSVDSTDFTLHSEAHLAIRETGAEGILGYNDAGCIEESLPGGCFLDLDGVEYASIQGLEKVRNATVTGLREGKFTLVVDVKKAGKSILRFTYPEVSVRQGTVAEVEVRPDRLDPGLPDLVVREGTSVINVSPHREAVEAEPAAVGSATTSAAGTSEGSPSSAGLVAAICCGIVVAAALAFGVWKGLVALKRTGQ